MRLRVFLGLGLVVPSLAWAAGNYMDRDKHKPSGASGLEGAVHGASVPETERALAVDGMGFYRSKAGETCGFTLASAPLTGRGNTSQEAGRIIVMKDGTKIPSDLSGEPFLNRIADFCGKGWTYEHVHKDGDKYFVRGVTVCTNGGDSADRSIQGVRLWYSKLQEGGELEKLDDPETWVSGTCTEWYDRAMCDVGWLAVGVKGHESGGRLRGLALTCAEVKHRE